MSGMDDDRVGGPWAEYLWGNRAVVWLTTLPRFGLSYECPFGRIRWLPTRERRATMGRRDEEGMAIAVTTRSELRVGRDLDILYVPGRVVFKGKGRAS
jgi:hypothetical protein